jgi:hypothetical protein
MGRKQSLLLEHVPDEHAEFVARIIGPQSGHAKALEQCRARRAEGEDVHLWRHGDVILVGPAIPADSLATPTIREGA